MSMPSEALVLQVPLTALPHLLEVHAVARRLSVSPEYVRRLIRDGRLRAIRLGTRWRVDPRDLETYIDGCRTAHREPEAARTPTRPAAVRSA